MSDLISRSALLDLAHNHVGGTVDCNDIARFPAVDAEPVRHERMTNPTFNGVKPVCTGCHIAYDKDPHWNYCPYCGCKMDAEVEG